MLPCASFIFIIDVTRTCSEADAARAIGRRKVAGMRQQLQSTQGTGLANGHSSKQHQFIPSQYSMWLFGCMTHSLSLTGRWMGQSKAAAQSAMLQ